MSFDWIDVGGTNTNGVLLKGSLVLNTVKAPTNHANLHAGTQEVLTQLLAALPEKERGPVGLHLSTTLATNAIVEGKGAPTAVLIIPGPGLRWEDLPVPFKLYPLSGAIDHRGRETGSLDREEVRKGGPGGQGCRYKPLAVVGSFAP